MTYGNVRQSCKIVYPRRTGYEEQQKAHAVLTVNDVINKTDELYLIGAPAGTRTYEIGGQLPVSCGKQAVFTELKQYIDNALTHPISYDAEFTGGALSQADQLEPEPVLEPSADGGIAGRRDLPAGAAASY